MCISVYRQVQFAPDAALFLAVFFHLTLPLTEDFKVDGVDNQMGNFAARGILNGILTDLTRLLTQE